MYAGGDAQLTPHTSITPLWGPRAPRQQDTFFSTINFYQTAIITGLFCAVSKVGSY